MTAEVWTYDLDGVLCEPPPRPAKAWRWMSGPERNAWRERMAEFKQRARVLHQPSPAEMLRLRVITARSEVEREQAEWWLRENFPHFELELVMLPLGVARSVPNVVAHKAAAIAKFGATDHAEDYRPVVRGLREALPGVRIWHFRGERMSLS